MFSYFLAVLLYQTARLGLFEGYLHERYQGFTRIAKARLEDIEEDFGSIEELIKEILDYEGEKLPCGLQTGPSWSEKIAEESLQVDDITHGMVDEKTVPDSEGRKRMGLHVSYERSPKNRERAIEIHGTICEVCKFDLDKIYGVEHAGGYIQIHHIKPISRYEGEVDPETDLVPLCVNCHVMAHRRRGTVTSIEEFKVLIKQAKG